MRRKGKKFGGWHTAPRPSLRQQIWSALRIERKAGKSAVAALVFEAGPTANQVDAVSEYLRALHKAGYLRVLRPGKGMGAGGVESRYLLYRDTGPLNPRWDKRRGTIYDPNTGETLSCKANRGQEWPSPGGRLETPTG